jgi:hypothetical protein
MRRGGGPAGVESRRIRWAENVAHMGEKRNAYKGSVELKKKEELKGLGVDDSVVLIYIDRMASTE